MNTKIIALTTATLLTLACSSETDSSPGTAGTSSVAGSSGSAASQAGAGVGGSPSAAGASGSGAGASPVGGAGASGSASGSGAGGASGSGGTAGGATAGAGGSSGRGGSSGNGGGPSGGAGGGGGTAGGGVGGGTGGTSDIAKALDGLRVDDGCVAGTTDTSTGAVCQHLTMTGAGFKGSKQATITGTPGTTYDVTLRIRGVVEPTSIKGGTRPTTTTFKYMNMDWRTVPYTVGGAVDNTTTNPDYTQWHIGVDSPKGDFWLNDYQKTGHYIFKLDYEVTIQVAANSTVTLDGTDRNERQIVNYEKYVVEGLPGSVNHGQFVQINVVSVKPH